MTESAFQALYEATNKSLWSYIYKLVNDTALTDDIFQESFVKLLQAETSRFDESRTRAYLFTIATNAVRDHWRKKKRERNWFESEPGTELLARDTGHAYESLDVHEAFEQLSPQHRSLLWLAYVEEYGHREIAEMLEMKEKSIRVLLFRAKQKFIEILKTLGITSTVNNE
ncbi:MAG: RNA polymerase sigma factor [Bacteroidetes bacterium]|nr:MAG: RNA polymerase sigma factor [Bacteroidota bacterium]